MATLPALRPRPIGHAVTGVHYDALSCLEAAEGSGPPSFTANHALDLVSTRKADDRNLPVPGPDFESDRYHPDSLGPPAAREVEELIRGAVRCRAAKRDGEVVSHRPEELITLARRLERRLNGYRSCISGLAGDVGHKRDARARSDSSASASLASCVRHHPAYAQSSCGNQTWLHNQFRYFWSVVGLSACYAS